MSTTTDPIVRDPDLLEGQAAFAGTRVPVWVLFNYLVHGRSTGDFLAAYPHIPREAVMAVLDRASRALVGQDSRGND